MVLEEILPGGRVVAQRLVPRLAPELLLCRAPIRGGVDRTAVPQKLLEIAFAPPSLGAARLFSGFLRSQGAGQGLGMGVGVGFGVSFLQGAEHGIQKLPLFLVGQLEPCLSRFRSLPDELE